jgi:glutaredoxin
VKWNEVKLLNNKHDVKVFTLTTCIWCKRVKQLLEKEQCTYKFIDVDLLEGDDRDIAVNEIKKYINKLSFPLIIIDEDPIQGYHEKKIRKAVNE